MEVTKFGYAGISQHCLLFRGTCEHDLFGDSSLIVYSGSLDSYPEGGLVDENHDEKLALAFPLQRGATNSKAVCASRMKRRLEWPCSHHSVPSVNTRLYLVLRSRASSPGQGERESSEALVSDAVRTFKCSRRAAIMHVANGAFHGGIL